MYVSNSLTVLKQRCRLIKWFFSALFVQCFCIGIQLNCANEMNQWMKWMKFTKVWLHFNCYLLLLLVIWLYSDGEAALIYTSGSTPYFVIIGVIFTILAVGVCFCIHKKSQDHIPASRPMGNDHYAMPIPLSSDYDR